MPASTPISTESKLPSMRQGGGGGPARFAPKEKPKNAKGTFARIFKIYLRWGKSILAAAFLTIVSSGVSVAIPYFVGLCFNTFDITTLTVDRQSLHAFILIIMSFYLISWFISTVNGLIMLRVSQKLVFVLRSEFYSKLQRLPLNFFDTRSHGDTMSRLTNDVDNISSTIAQATTQIIGSVLTIAGSFTVMINLSVPLTFTVLISVPLVAALTRLIAKRSRSFFLAQARSLGQLNGMIEESILGLKMVKAFGQKKRILNEFAETNDKLFQSSLRAQIWSGYMMPLMNVINNLIFTLVALVGGCLSVWSGLQVGTVVSFLNYSKQFGHPLNAVAGMFNTLQSALAGAERVFEIMDQTEETPDVPDAVEIIDTESQGSVTFKNVSFAYEPTRPILRGVNFNVKAGQTIALVGETGAGKTTIVNLLTRFYDSSEGEVCIDGVPIRKIKRSSLRKCFSVVLQETCLFSGTIMDNIRYGANFAYGAKTATDEQVIEAAKLAHAHEFIIKLRDGYNTLVSGSMDNLSEGQRQLLAIARAVLRQSPILILDEATSSVDTKTEKDIQRALVKLTRNRTSFLIAHRLSTIREADCIMVIGEGCILESGNHDELMKAGGRYYEMVINQMYSGEQQADVV